ncbi:MULTISPECIES: peroxiredoxin family protein [Cryobacterium]|uniref:peroxiredoxin family protein n=1 Tax=Cryobacterium TaxID=69578 RepID=UPI000CD45999|nr:MULTISPECIES: peroxiredoxin family protein [Cryobacterium]POH64577.1 alkyl hydroperoxide reductase [Cryobacterium zongtaii]TFC46288.1 peroxiredoxin family protein [Cryobacterium sp. TMN-39-2]
MASRNKKPAVAMRPRKKNTNRLAVLIGAGVVVAIFGAFFLILAQEPSAPAQPAQSVPLGRSADAADYAVGSPGVGEMAPGFAMESTSGDTVDLTDYAGKSVLLYFHEGLGCQPCWDQMRDLDAASDQLTAVGVDDVLTITSGPVDLIAQKMDDDKLASVALADTKMDVIKKYGANDYGMMGDSRAGHSFILVGPDGTIQWRADYGGAPDYTMYVSMTDLLADMTAAGVNGS